MYRNCVGIVGAGMRISRSDLSGTAALSACRSPHYSSTSRGKWQNVNKMTVGDVITGWLIAVIAAVSSIGKIWHWTINQKLHYRKPLTVLPLTSCVELPIRFSRGAQRLKERKGQRIESFILEICFWDDLGCLGAACEPPQLHNLSHIHLHGEVSAVGLAWLAARKQAGEAKACTTSPFLKIR